MKITVKRLKQLVREALGEAEAVDHVQVAADSAGLDDITTDRERANGTRTWHDPKTADVYKFSAAGHLRRYQPDWENGPNLYGRQDKSAHSTRSGFQKQNPVLLANLADGRSDPADALARSVERRRANLRDREGLAAQRPRVAKGEI